MPERDLQSPLENGLILDIYLTLGYFVYVKPDKAVSKAARAMAMRSVQVRREAWGKKEFVRRMQEYGKLGGRPKRSTKKLEA